MKKLAKIAVVVSVNLVLLITLLATIEIGFRIWGGGKQDDDRKRARQKFQPYVMFTVAASSYLDVTNTFTKQKIASTIRLNSLGFNDRREFSLTAAYHKAPGEKVILFTGGSAAWGFGATSTDATIAGRMEYYLNHLQTARRYSVVNLGMVGWIAFQELVALQL
jgi:hypothetical protein